VLFPSLLGLPMKIRIFLRLMIFSFPFPWPNLYYPPCGEWNAYSGVYRD
jgi:hypothetical protein